jgi:nucleotide-binding universal stress UspA family protein
MSHDPHRDMRRHLAAEAYEWRKRAIRENRPHLHAVQASAEPKAPVEAATEPPILVGYDGTAGALPALAWALREAQDRQAPLVIVRAWQWDEELAEPGLVGPQEQLSELAYSTLPDWVREAQDVSVLLPAHAAGPAIVEHSAGAAMIVVGRRRLGHVQRVWLGSTSAYVMQHAACPVVVVPETAADETQPRPKPAGDVRDGPAGRGTRV